MFDHRPPVYCTARDMVLLFHETGWVGCYSSTRKRLPATKMVFQDSSFPHEHEHEQEEESGYGYGLVVLRMLLWFGGGGLVRRGQGRKQPDRQRADGVVHHGFMGAAMPSFLTWVQG